MKKFNNKIWLSSPTMHGNEIKYMQEAYDTNWMTTIGKNIDIIEKECCKLLGCKYAVAMSSGTAALHFAVKLAGVKAGDNVFCTNMTFNATVCPVIYEGANPIFIDSEYETWNMDPVALKKAFELYPDTKVVIVANLYGTPAKFDEICEICKKHGATLIEDAAESLGATYKGKQTGSFGKNNVISFNGNKIITGSSGGMLLTNDEETAEKARKWSTQSREDAPWYQHNEIGYNYRMSNIIAGIVRGQIPYLEEHIALKKAIYERYKEGFKDLPVTMNPFIANIMKPNFWLSCLLINKDAMCHQKRTETNAEYTTETGKSCPTEILQKLEELNAEGRPTWKPMHMQPLYRNSTLITAKGELDETADDNVSADLFARGVCLPSDIKMTAEEQSVIIETIKSCFK